MRIAIIQGAFLPVPPLRGGAVEKMWYALAQNFGQKGHKIDYFSRRVPELLESEIEGNIRHFRVQGFNTPSSGLVLKFFDLIYTLRVLNRLTEHYDVIVTNTFWSPVLLKKNFSKRCFVDVQRMPKRQMNLYQNTGRLRANSEVVADAIRSELPDQHHQKVIMIPNPLPFTFDFPVIPKDKKKSILYVGRIHPEKGLELLIKAYRQLGVSIPLQIVGPSEVSAGGGGQNYLNNLKKQIGSDLVHFTGPIYDPIKLNEYYREAAVFVYPSVAERGETFGLAPLEAMSWGCVPLVSDLACFRDFIQASSNGLVFDHRSPQAVQQLAECLNKLLTDDDYRFRLAKEALKVRESHSIDCIANKFLSAFEQMKKDRSGEKIRT